MARQQKQRVLAGNLGNKHQKEGTTVTKTKESTHTHHETKEQNDRHWSREQCKMGSTGLHRR